MKKLLLIAVLILGGLVTPKAADAQIQIRVNIGAQPIWGPVGFEYVEYYYIPEIDVYYHVPTGEFIYYKNGRWIARKTLPSMYRHFDFFRTRVVVINEFRPFLRHHEIKRRYENYRDFRPYITIRDVRDPRYFVNKHHPEHYRWVKEQQRKDRDARYRDRDRDRRDNDRRDNDKRYNDGRDNDRRDNYRRDNDRRENDRKKVDKKNSSNNDKKGNRNDKRDNNRDNNRNGGSNYRR